MIGVGQDSRGFVGISLVPLIGGVGPGPGDDYLAPSLRPRLDLKRVHLLVGKSLDKLGVVGIAVALGGKQVAGDGAARCLIGFRSHEAEKAAAGGQLGLGQEFADLMRGAIAFQDRSEEHTSELQALMRISYAV